MSRLAKRPIAIPPGAEVTISDMSFSVRGPLGTVSKTLHRDVVLEVGPEGVVVTLKRDNRDIRPLMGTYAAHVKNMFEGVTKGFTKRLLIEGIGFRWEAQGNSLNLNLGFSHPVKVVIPDGLKVTIEKGVLSISGYDKEKVGQFAAEVRALKKPEPYKGKGIRYDGEIVRRKQGKKTA